MPKNQTKKQKKFFRAAAHNPDIAQAHGMTMQQARRMMNEGAKRSVKHPGRAY